VGLHRNDLTLEKGLRVFRKVVKRYAMTGADLDKVPAKLDRSTHSGQAHCGRPAEKNSPHRALGRLDQPQ